MNISRISQWQRYGEEKKQSKLHEKVKLAHNSQQTGTNWTVIKCQWGHLIDMSLEFCFGRRIPASFSANRQFLARSQIDSYLKNDKTKCRRKTQKSTAILQFSNLPCIWIPLNLQLNEQNANLFAAEQHKYTYVSHNKIEWSARASTRRRRATSKCTECACARKNAAKSHSQIIASRP